MVIVSELQAWLRTLRQADRVGIDEGGLTSGVVYLRDLPLNLDQLASLGFESARLAYRSECERIGVDWKGGAL